MPRLRRTPRAEHGITIIELLVALAVFAMFILLIDALFFSANRSARKAELAADVQQNARIAVERLTRELREARASVDAFLCPTLNECIVVDTSVAGQHRVLFKSARLRGTPTVFCLYVRDGEPNPDPLSMRGTSSEPWKCFRSFGGGNNVPEPPYTGPPYPLCEPNTDVTALNPCGGYTPIWQQYIGYFVVENPPGSGFLELRRVSGQLTKPVDTLFTTMLSGGDVIASYVNSFEICLNGVCPGTLSPAGNHFTVKLQACAGSNPPCLQTEVVQGVEVPAQQVTLPGGTVPRD